MTTLPLPAVWLRYVRVRGRLHRWNATERQSLCGVHQAGILDSVVLPTDVFCATCFTASAPERDQRRALLK